MNLFEEAVRVITPITEELGLPAPEFDEALRYYILVDDSLPTSFEIDDEGRRLIVNVVLGPLPDVGVEGILYHLMTANYLRLRTDGGTFGIDHESQMITLCDYVDLPVENPQFVKTRVESLLSMAAEFSRELVEMEEISTGADAVVSGDVNPMRV